MTDRRGRLAQALAGALGGATFMLAAGAIDLAEVTLIIAHAEVTLECARVNALAFVHVADLAAARARYLDDPRVRRGGDHPTASTQLHSEATDASTAP